MINLIEIQDNNTGEFHNIKVNKYSINYKKNWGTQQRNLVSAIRGTLIGISEDITFTSEYLNQDKEQLLTGLLNQAYFYIRFFDTSSNEIKTSYYTSSNINNELIRLAGREYTALNVTLNAVNMMVS